MVSPEEQEQEENEQEEEEIIYDQDRLDFLNQIGDRIDEQERQEQEENEQEEEEQEELGEEQEEEKFETIIVDGEKKEVPLSRIMEAGVQTLQKKEAADARLAEAVRLLEEAKKVTKETVHRPPEEGVLEIESTPHADVQELIETIQMGDSDEATKRLSRIFKLQEEKILAFHRRNQEISEGQAIINSFNSSPQNGGFSDIVEDPFLLRMANGFIDERLRKGEQNSWALYESVGKEVREWKEKTISKPEKEEEIKITDDLAKKRDKKKKIDSIESASQKATLAEEDTEKSYSEAIAEMQAERGKIKEI